MEFFKKCKKIYMTSLHFALENKFIEIVRLLLSRKEIDINITTV